VVDATPTRCSHLRRPSGDPRSFGSRPASAFSAVREPGEMAPYAPCRDPRSTRRTDWTADHQSSFPLPHVNAAAFASSRRLPPTGPADQRPCFHSNVALRAATGTPVLPPWAQLPTCVHAPAGSARPERLASYSLVTLWPHAAYRFLQLGDPRAHLRAVQTPRFRGGEPPRPRIAASLSGHH
jgi:hypothetical protein